MTPKTDKEKLLKVFKDLGIHYYDELDYYDNWSIVYLTDKSKNPFLNGACFYFDRCECLESYEVNGNEVELSV